MMYDKGNNAEHNYEAKLSEMHTNLAFRSAASDITLSVVTDALIANTGRM